MDCKPVSADELRLTSKRLEDMTSTSSRQPAPRFLFSPHKSVFILGRAGRRWYWSLCSWAKQHQLVLAQTSLIFAVILYMCRIWMPIEIQKCVVDLLGWITYWTVLGVLSSIGMGSGLHTFTLFLAPYLAKVTIIVSECDTLEFDVMRLDSFQCPEGSTGEMIIPIYMIFLKVCSASYFWGFGTVIGELPPYFIARVARLSAMLAENRSASGITVQRSEPRTPDSSQECDLDDVDNNRVVRSSSMRNMPSRHGSYRKQVVLEEMEHDSSADTEFLDQTDDELAFPAATGALRRFSSFPPLLPDTRNQSKRFGDKLDLPSRLPANGFLRNSIAQPKHSGWASNPNSLGFNIQRLGQQIQDRILQFAANHLGFWTVMLFSSIPNPLFDLIGFWCGHTLLPFRLFFGALLIGKGFIKATIQSLIVIFFFSKEHLDMVLQMFESLAPSVTHLVSAVLSQQRETFRGTYLGQPAALVQTTEASIADGSFTIAWVLSSAWSVCIYLMVFYFVVSVLDSIVEHELEYEQLHHSI